jgi:hypothetical protein
MDNLIGTQDNVTPSNMDSERPEEAVVHPAVGRRGLLRLGGSAALVGAAAALVRPAAAGAGTADSLHVTYSGPGDAIVGEAAKPGGAGCGVRGIAVGGAGVSGTTRGDGPGVRADVDRGAHGSALLAFTGERVNSAPTAEVRQWGFGDGVYAHIENADSAGRAIFGRTVGTGIAMVASVANERSVATAAKGITAGSGPGVEGSSAHGVGGRFEGNTAQVHLVPSVATSHPAIGAPGQLFVDRANRLWFCNGGSTWKQLA